MATQFSILALGIPWTGESGGLQSTGPTHTHTHPYLCMCYTDGTRLLVCPLDYELPEGRDRAYTAETPLPSPVLGT